ncbi:MAG: GYF domain-containing protein [Muribaculaceae bacterium]|nr:GYF domain-containing protein [Muribaculaceae bacterium]
MKYFAMIDGTRRGPYTLEELHSAGVTPDTYVWCKGMADWEKAEEVADICRFYRQRIFNLMHPSASSTEVTEEAPVNGPDDEDPYANFPLQFRGFLRQAGADPEIKEQEPDTSYRPTSLIPLSVTLLVLCCPITGFIALYYAIMSRRAWNEAHRSTQDHTKELYTDSERQAFSRKAHEYARLARMWCGITFFFGFFMAAIVSRFFS